MNPLHKIKGIVYNRFMDYLDARKIERKRNQLISEHGLDFIQCKDIELTSEEKQSLQKQWGWLGIKINYEWYKLFKHFGIFDPKLLALDIFSPVIIDRLNPVDIRYCLSNKSYFPVYFPGIRQPVTLLSRINGIYFDGKGDFLDSDDAKALYGQFGVCFIKPSKDTHGGEGVKRIDTSLFSFEQVMAEYPSDFIIQEALRQSDKTAVFNPDSVNTLRISTLLINGRASCCSAYFKFGQKGSHVDNSASRGYAVGVYPDGHFTDVGIDYHDGFIPTPDKMVHQTRDGLIFKDCFIPEVRSAVDFAIENHLKYFPDLGFIGWDIALNDKSEPVMIEVNLIIPGITTPQLLFGRSAFDDRVQEVIDFVKERLPGTK